MSAGKNDLKFKRNKRKIITIVVATVVILILILCLVNFVNAITGKTEANPQSQAVTVEKDTVDSVTFLATGDNLIHNTIYDQANERAGGNDYDFSYAYADIKPIIAGTDLVFVNQETPVATEVFEPSNYPMFNTPTQSVTALRDAGFNLFNLASNHTLDQGVKGMEASIEFMNTVANSTNFGLYRNYTDEHTPKLMEVKGITFSFIGITEMTNGMSLPSDTEMDIVYTSQTDKIQTMIDEAEKKSDVVVLSVHWGDENMLAADQRQKDMGKDFAEMGADLIIGHHPHVLQEIETVATSDGRKVPVVYSLGNFISAMSNPSNHIGGFFGCSFSKNDKDEVAISDLSFTPIVNYFTSGYQNIKVIPFSEYTPEMADNHGLGLGIDEVNDVLNKTVGADLLVDSNK